MFTQEAEARGSPQFTSRLVYTESSRSARVIYNEILPQKTKQNKTKPKSIVKKCMCGEKLTFGTLTQMLSCKLISCHLHPVPKRFGAYEMVIMRHKMQKSILG